VTVNLIMVAVTLLMVGFLAVWLFYPQLRPWIEAPKYRVLEWEQRWPAAVRKSETNF
jgi:hypothetical protein